MNKIGQAGLSLLLLGTAARAEPYNVLFIAIDDLNDYISVMADFPGVKTPRIDEFAETAFTFRNAYCSAPVCNPSRSSVLTGLSPHRTGLYENRDCFQASASAMDAILIPEHFKDRGYTTMWSGKLFHTAEPFRSRPQPRRVQAMWDDMEGEHSFYGPWPTVENFPRALARWFNYQAWTGPDTDFPDVVNTDLTIQRLRQSHEKPFFMVLGLFRPHTPWTAPERFFDLHPLEEIQPPNVPDGILDQVPPIARELALRPVDLEDVKAAGQWERVVQAYLACVSFTDYNIGRVLDELDQSPYRDNTIVIIWSDHGFHLGEKHHFAKNALWEQATRSPLLIRVPGLTDQGGGTRQPVSLLDIYPTLVDVCGLPAPAHTLDGLSLRPLMEESNHVRTEPALTFFRDESAAVRTADWRYIRYGDGTEELYDHRNDPGEVQNVAGHPEHRPVINTLSKWIPDHFKPAARR